LYVGAHRINNLFRLRKEREKGKESKKRERERKIQKEVGKEKGKGVYSYSFRVTNRHQKCQVNQMRK
jgi:hypothetical protein